jgi:transposase
MPTIGRLVLAARLRPLSAHRASTCRHSMAGPELLASVMVAKFRDHLPL